MEPISIQDYCALQTEWSLPFDDIVSLIPSQNIYLENPLLDDYIPVSCSLNPKVSETYSVSDENQQVLAQGAVVSYSDCLCDENTVPSQDSLTQEEITNLVFAYICNNVRVEQQYTSLLQPIRPKLSPSKEIQKVRVRVSKNKGASIVNVRKEKRTN